MIAPLRSEIRLADVLGSLVLNRGYRERLAGELRRYFGVPQVLLTHSARTALYFLLKALPQKKVYLPAYNCWAVPEAALYAGKELEYVDISLGDYNMDLAKLEAALEPDSIILATHQFGIPCDIEAILELARSRNCLVIEDNAAAFGSEIRGKKTGSFGAAGVVSFDYSKTVVSGKGGAILFNNPELYRKVQALHAEEVRKPGLFKSLKYTLLPLAYSYATHRAAYRLTYALFRRIRGSNNSGSSCDPSDRNESYFLDYDERRAKLAYLNLQRLPAILASKKRVSDFYLNQLAASAGIVMPELAEGVSAALVKFPIRLRGADRQRFYDSCIEKGVDLGFLFQFHYQSSRDACPNARTAASEGIALPVYGALDQQDLNRIKSAILDEKL